MMKALSTRRKRSPATTSNANAAGVVTLEMVAREAGDRLRRVESAFIMA